MKYSERLARFAIVLILIGLPAATIVYLLWPQAAEHRVIEINAFAPEAGGFVPASIQVLQGETVTLRFTSMDVTHGVAIGPGLGIDLGQIQAGHTKEVTVTFDQSGSYTFYCTTWCSPDHWRMRGVVDVQPQTAMIAQNQGDDVIEGLTAEGVDVDAGSFSRGAASHVNIDDRSTISPERGRLLIDAAVIPPNLGDPVWRQSHTPAEAFVELGEANPALAEDDLIDIVAYLWLGEQDANGSERYEQNCAACHGQFGNGDGPAASSLVEDPVAFAGLAYMFHMRSDVLYAKIRRGGMGTDMPNFGTLFTPQETWALVDYLWRLSFDRQEVLGRTETIWGFLKQQ